MNEIKGLLEKNLFNNKERPGKSQIGQQAGMNRLNRVPSAIIVDPDVKKAHIIVAMAGRTDFFPANPQDGQQVDRKFGKPP